MTTTLTITLIVRNEEPTLGKQKGSFPIPDDEIRMAPELTANHRLFSRRQP
jgi:hypothetical protein